MTNTNLYHIVYVQIKLEVFLQMARNEIRDSIGRIIGFIEDMPNGDKTVRDKFGKVLGSYRKNDNTTRDSYGRIIARGDACAMLIKG